MCQHVFSPFILPNHLSYQVAEDRVILLMGFGVTAIGLLVMIDPHDQQAGSILSLRSTPGFVISVLFWSRFPPTVLALFGPCAPS